MDLKIWEAPTRPVAALCRRAADDLASAIDVLTDWGVAVPGDSRLRAAVALLRQTASRGVLPVHLGRRRQALSALMVAVDYVAISQQLPPQRVATVRQELTQSIAGRLEAFGGTEAALQLQTQHWVGAILRAQGVHLRSPPVGRRYAGKRPDFLTQNHSIEYGIEVKRPRSRRRLVPSLHEAAAQLRDYGVRGAIIVDATDLLRSLGAVRTEETFNKLARSAHQTVWNALPGLQLGPAAGFDGTLVVALFARGAWQLRTGGGPGLRLLNFSSCATFATIVSGWAGTRRLASLDGLRANWMADAFNEGYRQMGGWALAESTTIDPGGA